MNNRQKNLLLGGALVVGGLIGCYILYRRNKGGSRKLTDLSPSNSRALVIKILKEIKNERIKLLTGDYETNKDVMELLKGHTVQTRKNLNAIIKSVCEKYATSIVELRDVCENIFKQDNDISVLFNDAILKYGEAFRKYSAKEEEPAGPPIPDYFTADVALTLIRDVLKAQLLRLNEVCTELRNIGVDTTENSRDPRLREALEQIDYTKIKEIVLAKNGLERFNRPLKELYLQVLEKFKKLNPDNFNKKLSLLEQQYKKAVDAISSGSSNAFILIEGLGAHLLQSSEEINIPMVRGFSRKLENQSYLQELAQLSANITSNEQ